ncbi:unnamed protein product [Parajaminaea phylloscopi]
MNDARAHGRSLDSALHVQAALADILAHPLRYERSTLQIQTPRYKPINDSAHDSQASTSNGRPGPSRIDYEPSPASVRSSAVSPSSRPPSASASKHLFQAKVPLTWPAGTRPVAAGLYNKGNTCYMNSTMQALVHTAPLTHLLLTTDSDTLKGRLGGTVKSGFDPVAALQTFAQRAIGREGRGQERVAPQEFIKNLKSVARTFSHGRQEDAHEWLRMLLDASQQACLALGSTKAKQSALRETTFVHKIFGGKLRSRVTCLRCKHNSDTFDPILDFSLDIRRCDSLRDAMDTFTEAEELRGSEKYRCEKCKVLVNARKHFKVEQCPNVMTVHLKRFTFTGSKISRPVSFPERFKMKGEWTSSGQDGPTYNLYAVVHHYGGGPHSGHYIAQVKSPAGKWMEMNDDMVTPITRPGHESKSAYILFYVRDAKERLDQAIGTAAPPVGASAVPTKGRHIPSAMASPASSTLTNGSTGVSPRLQPQGLRAVDEDAGSVVQPTSPGSGLESLPSSSTLVGQSESPNGTTKSRKLKRARSPLSSPAATSPQLPSRFSMDNGPKRSLPSVANGASDPSRDFAARSFGHKKHKHDHSESHSASNTGSHKQRRVSAGGSMKIKERMKPRRSV